MVVAGLAAAAGAIEPSNLAAPASSPVRLASAALALKLKQRQLETTGWLAARAPGWLLALPARPPSRAISQPSRSV